MRHEAPHPRRPLRALPAADHAPPLHVPDVPLVDVQDVLDGADGRTAGVMTTPYYEDESVTLYHGAARDA